MSTEPRTGGSPRAPACFRLAALLAQCGCLILATTLATPSRPQGMAPFADATSGALGDTGNGSGVAWGDYDNDGDLDLYLANYGSANKLFRNDANGVFVDATSGPLGDTGDGSGAAWGDYDNDGYLDLYLVNAGSANQLLRNYGSGIFADVTSGPLGDTGDGVAAAWADYDNDGKLDLYLVNFNQANKLLHNLGGGTFADATSGLLGDAGPGQCAAWGDYDNDGDLDLYLVNSGKENKLFRNDGGGTFVDVTSTALRGGWLGPGRSASWGDYDNDGDLDLFLLNYHQASMLFRNDGGGMFVNAPIGDLFVILNGMAAAWGDYDNDGDLDLYYVCEGQANWLVRNDGGAFVHVGVGTPVADPGNGQGVAWGDFDGDGDLDLYLANSGSANKLLRNEAAGGNHWLEVKLQGTVSNRAGIGARVVVTAGGVSRIREISGGSGGGSQDALVASFGLGAATVIDQLEVRWPSGIAQPVSPPAVDRVVTVKESGVTDATRGPLGDPGSGAGVAWGDYDNDGDLDLYLANAGSANRLFRNDRGTFVDATSGPLGDDGNGRGVAWGDVDNDGDLDLYLANDGSANRLFRNDGGGSFLDVAAGTPLADAGSGQAATWGDSDDDGDLDLYLVNFGEPNRLFRNDGGRFVDVAAGTPLADAGPGRAAAWGDVDNDGDLDLYLVNFLGMANRLFRNDGGTFVDVAAGTPLADAGNGRGAAWGDFDNDGDLDLYLAEFGSANKLFRNDGGAFVDIAGGTPFADAGFGVGVAWGDYDGDGDLDLYLANSGSANRLLRNQSAGANHWLEVTLEGTASNRTGIGARVAVVAGGITRIRELSGGSGNGSQNAPVASFGLGRASAIDSLIVRWPSGTLQAVHLLTAGADRRVAVTETASPILLSLFEAAWTGEGIEVRWRFPDPGQIAASVLERAASALAPWTAVTAERRETDGTVVVLDRVVERGRAYRYRLVATHRDGSTLRAGPLEATAGDPVRAFALQSLAPNPSPGPVEVGFAVAREARVRLTVLDLQGRQVALLADGVYPPGTYGKAWDGAAATGRAPPGLYFVRLEWPGASAVHRLAVIH